MASSIPLSQIVSKNCSPEKKVGYILTYILTCIFILCMLQIILTIQYLYFMSLHLHHISTTNFWFLMKLLVSFAVMKWALGIGKRVWANLNSTVHSVYKDSTVCRQQHCFSRGYESKLLLLDINSLVTDTKTHKQTYSKNKSSIEVLDHMAMVSPPNNGLGPSLISVFKWYTATVI
jgi:hypothetical protein